SSLSSGYTIGPNYRNISVDTQVNITNSNPVITSISLSEPANITLNAGGTYTLECNVSVRDYNNWDDIDTVNATLLREGTAYGAALNNNTIYRNSSCTRYQQGGFYANYTCAFDVLYYSEPGAWNCSVYVNDSYDVQHNATNQTHIDGFLALNVTTLIDYGQMDIGQTSLNKTANITNFGNLPINVSVYGYGATGGDGLAMVCTVGNIPIVNEKYSPVLTDDFAAKVSLSGTPTQIVALTTPKQTTNNQVINTTYWQLYIPPNPAGLCNGTVVFQAEAST
ncbi:hypothetical protein GOV10_02380, partial [Candidatus Woesearchaeota archaeon]|nr:hypothetical protein [Candidatus Woesearchaeota archaeon]